MADLYDLKKFLEFKDHLREIPGVAMKTAEMRGISYFPQLPKGLFWEVSELVVTMANLNKNIAETGFLEDALNRSYANHYPSNDLKSRGEELDYRNGVIQEVGEWIYSEAKRLEGKSREAVLELTNNGLIPLPVLNDYFRVSGILLDHLGEQAGKKVHVFKGQGDRK